MNLQISEANCRPLQPADPKMACARKRDLHFHRITPTFHGLRWRQLIRGVAERRGHRCLFQRGFLGPFSAEGVVSAGNRYLADSLIAAIAIGVLGQRRSLKNVQVLLRGSVRGSRLFSGASEEENPRDIKPRLNIEEWGKYEPK